MRALCVAAGLYAVLGGAALAQVTAIETLRPAMVVTVDGVVERITDDDEFLLADATGQIEVYIGPNVMPVRAGDKIRVDGQVDDDGPLELYATRIVMDDGRVMDLPNRF